MRLVVYDSCGLCKNPSSFRDRALLSQENSSLRNAAGNVRNFRLESIHLEDFESSKLMLDE